MSGPAERRAALASDLRAKISDAYYEARDAHQTMETAADHAAEAVVAHLEDLTSREALALSLRRIEDLDAVQARVAARRETEL